MFMSDVHKKEEIRTVAIQELRKLGVKYRPKKPKQHVKKSSNKVFNVPLSELPTQTVTLKTGQQIGVPKLVHDMCSYILTKVDVEGVFRKEGSKARQNEIRKNLSVRSKLEQFEEYHVIDVAVILKTFLRELTEPLIPYGFHEVFLLCMLLQEAKLDAILLACLLIPLEHLNMLSYLMQFFYEVAENSHKNKMTPYNLAVVIGPSVFPIEEKSTANPKLRTEKACELFRLLIENAKIIGVLPEYVIHRVGNIPSNSAEEEKKRRKRRSGSLTRMFNGLKKIVGGKSVDESSHIVTPDLLLTPVNRSVKKRRMQANGLSIKKKRELISNLPDNVLLNTPFTPQRTPVNMNLSGTNEKQRLNHSNEIIKEKKAQWFSRSRSVKNLKHDDNEENKKSTKTLLERRWSAVNQACNIRRNKKRNSSTSCLTKLKTSDLPRNSKNEEERDSTEPDYVRVPKNEFEEFINKVSAIERRISSFELENVQSRNATIDNENNSNGEVDSIKNVQTAYEQTLVQAEPLSPTTDQLARRLSRDLKIRRSAEQKIIRSPSARKIGSMRRRSRELERNNTKLIRHQSWHVASKGNIPRVNLKRGKPNTVTTGLPVASKLDDVYMNVLEIKEIKQTPRSSLSTDAKGNVEVSCNLSGSSNETWMSAEGFFSRASLGNPNSFNDRASLAKLRSQNAGMVLAKAKLFDNLKDSDGSTEYTIPRPKIGNKIGSIRNIEPRVIHRVKALKSEDRRLNRKSMSPRRRNAFLTNKHKLVIKQSSRSANDKENLPESFNSFDKSETLPFKDCNRIDGRSDVATPKATPQIKKSLYVRSPKRLCRTPGTCDRGTPLKVLATPVRHLL